MLHKGGKRTLNSTITALLPLSSLSQESTPATLTFFSYYSVKCRYISRRKFPVNKESPPYTFPLFPNASILMGIDLDIDKGDKRRVKNHRGTIQAFWRFYEQCYYFIHELLPPPCGLLHAHWHWSRKWGFQALLDQVRRDLVILKTCKYLSSKTGFICYTN